MKTATFVMSSCALLAASAGTIARAQPLPEGTVYVFHSAARGGCPALDWHIVSGADGQLQGMISWNDMKSMAHATGTIDQSRNFKMTATEVGGAERTATVTGKAESNGFLTADIVGPGVDCKGITVPIWHQAGNQ